MKKTYSLILSERDSEQVVFITDDPNKVWEHNHPEEVL